MFPYKKELRYYEISPKFVPAHKSARITIRPLGKHARFPARVSVFFLPLEETTERWSPSMSGSGAAHADMAADAEQYARIEAEPGDDGCLRVEFTFGNEQKWFVRVFDRDDERGPNEFMNRSNQNPVAELAVYALEEDLYRTIPLMGDLHLHTTGSDGREEGPIVAAAYRRNGFDFIAVTDHFYYEPSVETRRFFEDVPIGLNICRGEEVHAPQNHTHIVNFGGSESVNSFWRDHTDEYYAQVNELMAAMPRYPGVDPFEYAASTLIFQKIRECGGAAIFAHPHWTPNVYHIREAMSDRFFEDGAFDAFELVSGYGPKNLLQLALWQEHAARGHVYPVVGSSDAHVQDDGCAPSSFTRARTVVFAEENSERSLVRAVKSHHSVAVQDMPGAEYPLVYGERRMVKLALFALEEYFPVHDEMCVTEGAWMKAYALGDEQAASRLRMISGDMPALWQKYFPGAFRGE